MEAIDIQIVEYNSELQKKSIELRYKVLRKPLGMIYTEDQLAAEHDEIHIVAVLSDAVVGVVVLKELDADTLKMRQVAVDVNYQKSGIGKEMVLFSEQFAQENGFKVIVLHARDVAKDFYLKLNYEVVSDEFIEVGIPHYEMKKELK